MNPKHIIKALPLLASVLGRKYGVEVRIGGDQAFTNGNIIQLPSLPLDGDENVIGLLRGYLDHEAAHIRATDFDALSTASVTPLEKHIWNMLEDHRVENVLSGIYPGCRENFQWIIKHLFLPKPEKSKQKAAAPDPALLILDWLLITVRSWDVGELGAERDCLRASAEIHYPGLTHELEPFLRLVPKQCASTQDAFGFACEIANIIRKYAQVMEEQQKQEHSHTGQGTSNALPEVESYPSFGQTGAPTAPRQALQSLQKLVSTDANSDIFPSGVGEQLQQMLSNLGKNGGERVQIAVATPQTTQPLSPDELNDSRQATTALRTRLQALMQSIRSVRNHSAYTGALNIRRLHSLATGNAKVFLRKGEKAGVNTAVHILLDASGSMNGKPIALAVKACFAVASALQAIPGVSVGVTAFPGNPVPDLPEQQGHWQTVAPVLLHGQKLHTRFTMKTGGSTPMDAALWWVLQQLHSMTEPRKIVVLISDGEPDDLKLTQTAIRAVKDAGMEVYGIGIHTISIQTLLPGKGSRVINDIAELAPSMFAILHDALIRKQGENV